MLGWGDGGGVGAEGGVVVPEPGGLLRGDGGGGKFFGQRGGDVVGELDVGGDGVEGVFVAAGDPVLDLGGLAGRAVAGAARRRRGSSASTPGSVGRRQRVGEPFGRNCVPRQGGRGIRRPWRAAVVVGPGVPAVRRANCRRAIPAPRGCEGRRPRCDAAPTAGDRAARRAGSRHRRCRWRRTTGSQSSVGGARIAVSVLLAVRGCRERARA